MVKVFAQNLTLVCIGAGPVVAYSDPVPLNGYDRLACICRVHSIQTNSALGAPQLAYTALLSNDGGATEVSSAVVTGTLLAAGAAQVVGAVNAAFVQFQFALSNPAAAGGDLSVVCFDLHVNFEKA